MELKAKMICNSVESFNGGQHESKLTAVTNGSDENRSYSLYTPSGSLRLMVDNPDAVGFFKPGKEYYITISESEGV